MANLITTIEGLASGRQVVPHKAGLGPGGGEGTAVDRESRGRKNLDP